ncbi:cation diffusion facilitator family transporter [Cohnella silvisoli]|uniref:Cation diffusion facilitator family transporter n=1 Tax=Cohnella silvisoli TaxID=2873699 RepID=A0ABV1KY84_9BACL|nr:cation diffusion facilitator family transporter [Cohnella silvisoli]MCD9026520.1 cation diffusion facilitator family transporter [Cohnella silvisoli]
MQSTKIAGLSILSNSFVVLLKLVVGIVTGSVAVISEAIHSLLDLMASVIAYFSVRISSRPPDRDHPYGHGKFENVSGTVETLLIFVAGIWIIYESVKKLLHPEPIHLPLLGVVVMLVGAGINLIVGRVVKRAGEKMQSVAMRSNALHLLTDVYTSLGVAVSLLLVSLTDLYILDPLIGIALAVYIMKEAVSLGKESFMPLLDTRLSKEEERKVREIIDSYKDEFIEYHNFRTRRSGPEEYIDFHLVVPSNTEIEIAHNLCDRIEKDIQEVLYNPTVMIHIEPEHESLIQPQTSN